MNGIVKLISLVCLCNKLLYCGDVFGKHIIVLNSLMYFTLLFFR